MGQDRSRSVHVPCRSFRVTPLAIAIASVLYPAAATLAAQDSGNDTLEEVIVTATRREENLQDVPQSVTALSTEFIEKQALTNLYDLVGALPSLNIVQHLARPEQHRHARHLDRLRRNTASTARSRSTSTSSR